MYMNCEIRLPFKIVYSNEQSNVKVHFVQDGLELLSRHQTYLEY